MSCSRAALASPSGGNDPPAKGTDYLCEKCFSIRSRPSRLKKLAHWEEWARGDIIWVHISLDFDLLCETLRALYLEYLRKSDPATTQGKAEIRFSLLAEFQADYERFEASLLESLLYQFGADRVEVLLPSLFCVKAEKGQDVLKLLRIYLSSLNEFLPAFLSGHGCPIRLSVALSAVRHPFFDVWRFWQAQQSEIEILTLGHGRLRIAARNLEKFLQLSSFQFRPSALHNLAEIARISQSLAELRFRARRERGERETFEQLGQFLPLGLDFEGILTLAKLIGA